MAAREEGPPLIPGPQPGVALYVHVPFCRARCHYCDFYSGVAGTGQAEAYVEALSLEVERRRGLGPFASIYVGGGTPSVLPEPLFRRLLELLAPLLAPGGEWTLEANPESLTRGKLQALRAAGATRLSLGIQTLRPDRTRLLGRVHGPAEAREAMAMARDEGPPGFACDLLLALPGQEEEEVADLVEELLAAGAEHISFYLLTLEEGTRLAEAVAAGEVVLPDAETQARLLRSCRALLGERGLPPYEISNAARPGRECRHNLRYWLGGDYLGLGPSAASLLEGRRWRCVPDLGAWLEAMAAGREARIEEETLPPARRAGERGWLQLRTSRGLDLEEVRAMAGCSRSWVARARRRLEELAPLGLVERVGPRWRLTEEGVLQADGVGAALL